MTIRSYLCAAAFSTAACVASSASAQLLAYDGFGGGPVADLQGSTGGNGWAGPWLDQTYDAVTAISGPGLTYPNLDTTAGAAVTEVGQGVYPMSAYYRSFAPLPPGTTKVYISFLMRADAGYGTWGGLSFGTYPFEMIVGSPPGMYAFGMMLSEGLGDISNAPLIEGQTNLVVIRISKNAGNGITYKLYLDPTIGGPEPSFALAEYGSGPVNAIPTYLRIDNGGGFTTDEVRVGTTWASVLPVDPGCLGDLNHDMTVNGGDLAMMLGAWGTTIGDLNGSGTTDAADMAILLGAWGPCN